MKENYKEIRICKKLETLTHNQGVPGSNPGGPTPELKGYRNVALYFFVHCHTKYQNFLTPIFIRQFEDLYSRFVNDAFIVNTILLGI